MEISKIGICYVYIYNDGSADIHMLDFNDEIFMGSVENYEVAQFHHEPIISRLGKALKMSGIAPNVNK